MKEWLVYNRIEEMVIKDRKCSLSYIQRKFHLTYKDAMDYIGVLIENKIVDVNLRVI